MRIATTLLVLVLLAVQSSFAAPAPMIVKLDGKGGVKKINIPAGSPIRTITAYVPSKGNITQYVSFNIAGPKGVNVTGKAILGKSGKYDAQLKTTKDWVAMKFAKGGKELSAIKLTGSSIDMSSSSSQSTSSSSNQSGNFYCAGFTVGEIDEMIRMLAQYANLRYTRDGWCSELASNGFNGNLNGFLPSDDSNGGGTGSSDSMLELARLLVRKDTCNAKSNSVYLVRLDISLSGVSAQDFANGFQIQVSSNVINYAGRRAASIKPNSDGKFAPRPLYLMATTGGFGGNERINVVKFSKNKPGSPKKVRVEDYVYYRGYTLARAVADSTLRMGGKANVELQSDNAVYSVCFRMSKSRQKVNGYPG